MAPHPQRLNVTRRAWPLARPFGTASGVVASVDIVVAEISDGDSRGRGEGVPLARFEESVESVVAQMEALKGAVSAGLDRERLQSVLPAGAARNALDCAFWAIEANRAYCSVAELAGVGAGKPVATAFTLGVDTPEAMGALAEAQRGSAVLKVMLSGDGADVERVRAVRAAAPASRLIVDAEGCWGEAQLREYLPALADLRVELIEQPLPAGADEALAGLTGVIPFCADESCRGVGDLDRLGGMYEVVNVGLDKVGGLTEALALMVEARRLGLRVMVGGGISTSLGVAPALLVAEGAEYVDLCGPLILGSDRMSALRYEGRFIQPAEPGLWGAP
jgi:L-Ala-D/L-Glu epimerase